MLGRRMRCAIALVVGLAVSSAVGLSGCEPVSEAQWYVNRTNTSRGYRHLAPLAASSELVRDATWLVNDFAGVSQHGAEPKATCGFGPDYFTISEKQTKTRDQLYAELARAHVGTYDTLFDPRYSQMAIGIAHKDGYTAIVAMFGARC